MNWLEQQDAFAKAVRNPTVDVPAAVGPRKGAAAPTERFNIYRNNSAVSLTEAMADGFPVVAELVGEEFFAGMARAYVAENLPASPVLLHYGATFPEFIEAFEPAEGVPFLADVARVEWAWAEAYHAQDRNSISAAELQSIDAENLTSASLELHPSVQLIQSDWPVVSLWSAHQIDDPDQRAQMLQKISQEPEFGFIVRPQFDVNVHRTEVPILKLLRAFQAGASLGAAAEQLGQEQAAEFGGMLGYIFSTGAVVAIRTND